MRINDGRRLTRPPLLLQAVQRSQTGVECIRGVAMTSRTVSSAAIAEVAKCSASGQCRRSKHTSRGIFV
jgi:hypothetical protein